MTIPEKVAFPPKYSAYLFDDDTIMKNDIYEGHRKGLFPRPGPPNYYLE